ncbi:peptidylprolyl isomerase [Porticoccus sp. GXU_MW_L64]
MKPSTFSALALLSGALLANVSVADNRSKTGLDIQQTPIPNSSETIDQVGIQPLGDPIQPGNPHPQVRLETSFGNVLLRLRRDRAPITADNFLRYVVSGRFDNIWIQRIVKDYVIQSGAFNLDLSEIDTFPPIPTESGNGLSNTKYSLAMAMWRPHTAKADFFINMKDNLELNPASSHWGFAVFGEVIDGFDTLDKINALKTEKREGQGFENFPSEQLLIKRAVLLPVEDLQQQDK